MKGYRLNLPFKWMEYPAGVIRFLRKHYGVVLVVAATSVGCGAMAWLAVQNIFFNPDFRFSFENMPRNEYLFWKRWDHSERKPKVLPPVRMHCDASLEFPYDDQETYVRRDEPCKHK